MLLGIELQPLFSDFAKEVDGQVGNAQHRPGKIDEHGAHRPVLEHADAPRQGEVAVEPGVEQHAAVGFNGELAVAVSRNIGRGLESEVRGIGVRTQNPETRLGRRRAPHLEGHQASVVAHNVAAGPGSMVPEFALGQAGKPGRLQAHRGFGHRVVGGGREIDEGQ